MKRIYLIVLLFLIMLPLYSIERNSMHSYNADYSLLPESQYSEIFVRKLQGIFNVNYCYQAITEIPKSEVKGYDCGQILKMLDNMGGLDKKCYGVSYIDGNTGERKPLFKKSKYDKKTGELYIKDKAAGGLYFDLNIDKKISSNTIYSVMAVVSRTPSNIFVRDIKKGEAAIFVLMQEEETNVKLYVLIQSSYSPLKHWLLTSAIESAISGRVIGLQDWFYRMLCTKPEA